MLLSAGKAKRTFEITQTYFFAFRALRKNANKWLFEKWKNKFAICLNLFTSHLVEEVEESFSYLPLVCYDLLCSIFSFSEISTEVILTKHLCFSSTLYNAIPGTHASYYGFQTPIYCSLDLFLGGQRVRFSLFNKLKFST